MSGLLEALQRLEGRTAAPSTSGDVVAPEPISPRFEFPEPQRHVEPSPLATPQVEPTPVAPIAPPREVDRYAVFVDALKVACPAPALVAFLSIGVEGSITSLLRDHADAVARSLGRDVVLLGPGLLDDPDSPTSCWAALRERGAYGFVHADAAFALARPATLKQVAAVVPVVELGKSSTRAATQLRRLLAVNRIPVLGATVIAE